MYVFSFEKLTAYQATRKLALEVYKIIRDLPSYETFALGSQLRRSMISVTSNIAEGCGRISYKEKIHFLEIAYSSLLEVYSQIQMSVDLFYVSNEQFIAIQPQFAEVARLINALRKSYIKESNSQSYKH